MVPEDFEALSARRVARARLLSERFPASREVLAFYVELVSFQRQILPRLQGWETLGGFRELLLKLIRDKGPERLRQATLGLDDLACQKVLSDYWQQHDTSSPLSFVARVLLQPFAAIADLEPAAVPTNRCPRCGHRPQVGVLRPQGEGRALSLACSLCLNEWEFRRGCCTACGAEAGKKLAYYTAPDFDHLTVQACDGCAIYLHNIDLAKDPAAIPEVDELAALPIDVWAREQGYRKAQPNLAGV